jgi:hypothetical protein
VSIELRLVIACSGVAVARPGATQPGFKTICTFPSTNAFVGSLPRGIFRSLKYLASPYGVLGVIRATTFHTISISISVCHTTVHKYITSLRSRL